jgi:hypothetical protein
LTPTSFCKARDTLRSRFTNASQRLHSVMRGSSLCLARSAPAFVVPRQMWPASRLEEALFVKQSAPTSPSRFPSLCVRSR